MSLFYPGLVLEPIEPGWSDEWRLLTASLCNEVSSLDNRNRGSDRRPATIYLQQAVFTAMRAWAVLLWLIREQASLGISTGLGFGIDSPLTFHLKSCRVRVGLIVTSIHLDRFHEAA